jgi:hypothetical protein
LQSVLGTRSNRQMPLLRLSVEQVLPLAALPGSSQRSGSCYWTGVPSPETHCHERGPRPGIKRITCRCLISRRLQRDQHHHGQIVLGPAEKSRHPDRDEWTPVGFIAPPLSLTRCLWSAWGLNACSVRNPCARWCLSGAPARGGTAWNEASAGQRGLTGLSLRSLC